MKIKYRAEFLLVLLIIIYYASFGSTAAAEETRFISNGDGTITDTLTGRMWLKDGNCLGAAAWGDGHDIIDEFNAAPFSYFCNEYGGFYTDWRYPSINELEGLVTSEISDSAGWLNDNGFINIVSGEYWSASTYRYDIYKAWYVMMNNMTQPAAGHKFFHRQIWAVR